MMKNKSFRKLQICSLFIMFCFIGKHGLSQESLKDRSLELVITGGAWLSGPSKIWVGDISAYTTKSISPLVKAMGDVYINQHFVIGLYLNVGPGYNHTNISTNNTAIMFEYGAGFKPVFYLSDKTAVKVGTNVGWRTHKSAYSSVDGHGLGVNCSVEIQHLIKNNNSITFEPGFLSQPVGYADNDTRKYTYAPIFYMNAGLTISAFRK
jgi:hypothetical protein